jgi:uncharacterized protein
MNKNLTQRILMVCIGVLILSFAVSLFIYASLGTDPASCMNLGVSSKVGLSFGVWQLLFNCIVLVFTFFLARRFIGIGTVINMVAIGFLADFFNVVLSRILPTHPGLLPRILIMLFAVVIISFAAALYIYPQLGISPYDSVAFILAERLHIEFRWCRIAWDVSAVAIGFFCGSIVGAGTVVTAFCLGPLIKYFNDLLQKKFPLQFN